LRVEGISYAQDANYVQLGLIYRTGRRAERKQPAGEKKWVAPVEPTAPEPKPISRPEPVAKPARAEVKRAVDQCRQISGVLEGVIFRTGSAQLTARASRILDKVSVVLSRCSHIPVQLAAHTDNVGNAKYNLNLSRHRAASVMRHLAKRGIARSRLKARAYGEAKPIAPNSTEQGRSRNRRVELIAR